MLERLRPLPVCTIGSREPGVPCVAINNSSGVRALTRHLIEKHACADSVRDGPRPRGRATPGGISRRISRPRRQPRGGALDPRRFPVRGGPGSGRQAVGSGGGCDAIVAANDWMALGALEALRARGLRVPEDVAVVGFDDLDDAKFATPPLTTVGRLPASSASRPCAWCWRACGAKPAATSCWRRCSRFGSRAAVLAVPDAGIPSRRHSPARRRVGPTTPPGRAHAARGPRGIVAAARLVGAHGGFDSARSGARPSGSFLATVDEIIGGAAEVGNVSAWHQPIATLRREVIRDLAATTSELALAESIFESTHILIGDHAERVQGRRRLATEAAFRASRISVRRAHLSRSA